MPRVKYKSERKRKSDSLPTGQAVVPVSQQVTQHNPHNGNCRIASGVLVMGPKTCLFPSAEWG